MSEQPIHECAHERWIVQESTSFGFGSCLDCGKEVPIYVLFNNLRDRMLEALKRAK